MKVSRVRGALALLLLISLALLGAPGGVTGADPEPWVDPDLVYNIEPGPGWPEGWSPPPAPIDVPDRARSSFEELRANPNIEDKPSSLSMRVLSPHPNWTSEYPYQWNYSLFQCGLTMYVHYYPEPDTALIYQTTGATYFANLGAGTGSNCKFTPVTTIQRANDPSDEENLQAQLEERLIGELIDARRSISGEILAECVGHDLIGSLDSIPVCFNAGYASGEFDVPAYLDAGVGRVRVPVRFVSEMMGAVVHWDESDQSVTIKFAAHTREWVRPITRPGFSTSDWWQSDGYSPNYEAFRFSLVPLHLPERTVRLKVGENQATVDGTPVEIDAPPVIKQGRVMVPVRFVAQATGAKVYWVGENPIWPYPDGVGGTRQVHIYSLAWPYYDNPSGVLEAHGMKF